jgi:hypothetical protein
MVLRSSLTQTHGLGMHDDDETRFPDITLWQFLGGVLWGVLYAGSWLAGYGGLDSGDKARWRRRKHRALKPPKVHQSLDRSR